MNGGAVLMDKRRITYTLERIMSTTGNRESKTFFDAFCSEFFAGNIEGGTVTEDFKQRELDVTNKLYKFCECCGINEDSAEYEALLSITYEYEKISFRAGFETAKELLK